MLKCEFHLAALGCLLSLVMCGCGEQPLQTAGAQSPLPEAIVDVEARVARVLTQEERDNFSPDEIFESLIAGNRRFVAGTLTLRDHSSQVRKAATGQYPKAVVLSCVDSRIPVEDVFDRGIGDIFVARVAGNFENTDILGSMEFACNVSGAKLIFVLGHKHCGAIKGAIDGIELGNITAMLKNIRPAVDSLADYDGDKSSANENFVQKVAKENVRLTIDRIRERSPILREMESEGKIKIVGGIYQMETGEVKMLTQ